MSLYNYVGTPNNNLICCICRAPFIDPITTTTCQHTFCRDCILRALSHTSQCPVDRSSLMEHELGYVNPIIRSMVDELPVECLYREEGCQWQGERQQLATHLTDKCDFSEEGQMRSQYAKENSKNEESSDWMESLSNITNSCSASSSQTAQSTTEYSETDTERECAKPSEPRINQLTEQNIRLRHRVDGLESVVQTFRKEMNAVKMVLEPWMRNVAAPPRPTPIQTHQSSVVTHDPGPSNEPHLFSPSTSPTTLRGPSFQSETAPPNHDSPHSNVHGSPITDGDDLASYFPAEDEVRVRQPAQYETPSAQRQRPGHVHHHSVPNARNNIDPPSNFNHYAAHLGYTMPGGYNAYSHPFPGSSTYNSSASSTTSGIPAVPTPPQQAINFTIPDLDVSSPYLVNTLQDLHSSLGSLTSVVEEVNRKSDVALALIGGGSGVPMMGGGVVGEVLRLGEEVMGVRASVQGLRMQVHGMLMGAVGGGQGMPNVGYMPRQPVSPSAANSGMSEDDGPGGRSPMSGQGMGMSMNARALGFPGPLGITKL